MSKPEPGAARHRLLIALNRIVAVLSIGAALLLYMGEPHLGVPRLAAAPWHEPLIVHCLLTALLLCVAAVQLGRIVRPDLVALSVRIMSWVFFPAFGFINLMLAVRAAIVFGFDHPLTWVFGTSGLLLGWMLPVNLVRNMDNEDFGHAFDRIGEPSGYGPIVTLGMHLWMGFLYMLAYGAAICTLRLAIPYFRLLDAVFLEQKFDGWFESFSSLLDTIKPLFPDVAAGLLLMFSCTVLGGMVAAAAELLARLRGSTQ